MQTFWTNIIGLSRRDCECSATNRPDGFDTSKSGYYITDLEPLNNLKGVENCEIGNIWDALTDARTKAINEVRTDIQKEIINSGRWKFARRIFQGEIGNRWFDNNITLSYTYAGIKITCLNVPGGTIKIKKITTLFAENGTITLQIYDNELRKIGDDVALTKIADTAEENEVSIELPMLPKGNRLAEYYLIYATTGHTPKNCEIGNIKEYTDWISVNGIQGADTDFYCEYSYNCDQVNGLIIDIETLCDPFLSIARDDVNFDNDPLTKILAQAVNYKAAELLGRIVLASNNLNRETLISSERMGEYLTFWYNNYAADIKYVAENIDPDDSGCFDCIDRDKLKIMAIKV